jgi:hypothetical protein
MKTEYIVLTVVILAIGGYFLYNKMYNKDKTLMQMQAERQLESEISDIIVQSTINEQQDQQGVMSMQSTSGQPVQGFFSDLINIGGKIAKKSLCSAACIAENKDGRKRDILVCMRDKGCV